MVRVHSNQLRPGTLVCHEHQDCDRQFLWTNLVPESETVGAKVPNGQVVEKYLGPKSTAIVTYIVRRLELRSG
jgi:hypothetical protein